MSQHRQQVRLSRTFETNLQHSVEKNNESIERTDFPNTHSFNCNVCRCYGPLVVRPTVPHKRALTPILVRGHLLHQAASLEELQSPQVPKCWLEEGLKKRTTLTETPCTINCCVQARLVHIDTNHRSLHQGGPTRKVRRFTGGHPAPA